MEDENDSLSLDQYYTSLKDFNQYSKPKMIEDNLEKINKNITKIQERLEELSGDTIFAGNDQVSDLMYKLNDAKKYVQSSLIPATEKIKKLQELLEKRNSNKHLMDNNRSDALLEKVIVSDDSSFNYNPKFSNYLNNNSLSSVDRLKSIRLSNLDVEIYSLIKEIKELSSYQFGGIQLETITAIQALYGVIYPGVEDQIASVQPKYGVECPGIGDQIASVQPKYGVEYPGIGDQIVSVQPKYGVECPSIGDQIASVQPKYGVECPSIGSQITSVQPKYGVEYPSIGSQITSVQPK